METIKEIEMWKGVGGYSPQSRHTRDGLIDAQTINKLNKPMTWMLNLFW